MYGDSTVIRQRAGELREQAAQIRDQAESLIHLAGSVAWSGWSAEAMRSRCRTGAAGLRRSAGAHEDAADALDRHAAAVDRTKDLIADTERRLRRLVADAGELLIRLPAPGSLAWLATQLPGVD